MQPKNITEDFARIFGGSQQQAVSDNVDRCVMNWDVSFDGYVKKFVAAMRKKGYMCDLLGFAGTPTGGRAALLRVSKDGKYYEHYQIFYAGLEIGWEYVER